MQPKLSQVEFIKLVTSIHGKFDYSLVSYTKDSDRIRITKNLGKRLIALKSEIGHTPEVLYYAPSNLYDTILTEQSLHDMLSEHNYISPVKFGGYTECFTLTDELASDLIEYLDTTFGENTLNE